MVATTPCDDHLKLLRSATVATAWDVTWTALDGRTLVDARHRRLDELRIPLIVAAPA